MTVSDSKSRSGQFMYCKKFQIRLENGDPAVFDWSLGFLLEGLKKSKAKDKDK